MVIPDSTYTIVPVTPANVLHVPSVFRSIYGEAFPLPYVYDADLFMAEIEAKRLAASLAFDTSGMAIGYISVFKNAPNPRLWEGGNLMVVPDRSTGDLAGTLLKHYVMPGNLPPCDGIFSEAVCHHYFSQFGCSKVGLSDCAIALDQLDGHSFTEHRPDTDRVACLLQFKEYSHPCEPVYLPACYDRMIRRLFEPLHPRRFLVSEEALPPQGETVREDAWFDTAGTWRISIRSVGNGWLNLLEELITEAFRRKVTSLQVVLSSSLPYLGAVVESLRQRGFFFGGIFPRWFGGDGIMLQQVLSKEPDYDGIKLYTGIARDLLAFIRSDRDTAMLGQGG